MFEWFKRQKLKKRIAEIEKTSFNENFLDKQLKKTAEDYAMSLREIEKLKKIIEARRRVNDLQRAIGGAHQRIVEQEDDDDDFDDEEEEEEEGEENFEETLMKMLKEPITNALKNKVGVSAPSGSITSPVGDLRSKAQGLLDGMNEEQISALLKATGKL